MPLYLGYHLFPSVLCLDFSTFVFHAKKKVKFPPCTFLVHNRIDCYKDIRIPWNLQFILMTGDESIHVDKETSLHTHLTPVLQCNNLILILIISLA